jgi:acetyltransferase-like isoleucine patch superfamily enzyme
MAHFHQFLALSPRPVARGLRALRRGVRNFTLPAPRVVVKPMLWSFLAVRLVYYCAVRLFICEPLFKASCKQYGRGVRTDVYIHFIQGQGDIILGDDVLIDGKCSFTFASRYTTHPTLEIGDHSGVGHNCSFTIGNRITIGRFCRLASDSCLFDSSGHASDPTARQTGTPAPEQDVRPIVIADNVWIGRSCIIYPGVTIGEGSIVSAGSVVVGTVPPYTVVAGNPARKIATLPRPAADGVQPTRPSRPIAV